MMKIMMKMMMITMMKSMMMMMKFEESQDDCEKGENQLSPSDDEDYDQMTMMMLMKSTIMRKPN